jgi:hypothetical protein
MAQREKGVLGSCRLIVCVEKNRDQESGHGKDYISAGDADADISSYFNSLSSKPAKVRSVAASGARKDLKGFFSKLKKGDIAGLLPRPSLSKAKPAVDEKVRFFDQFLAPTRPVVPL